VHEARELDSKLNNTPLGVQGPVLAKLNGFGEVKGLVFGAFGEVSQSVATLVGRLGSLAAFRTHRDLGNQPPQEVGRRLGWVFRRRLALTGWRALARLRLSRARFVGVHGDVAAQRRVEAEASREVVRGEFLAGLGEWVQHSRLVGEQQRGRVGLG
jgi:hypothetical protein